MKFDTKGRAALAGLAMLMVSVGPASAFVYGPGSGWQTFTTWADVAAPVAGYGPFGGTSDVGPDNEPFAFTLYAPGYLKVTDLYQSGDSFRVFNFGAWLGETPASVFNPAIITNDPSVAFASASLSHGEWLLGAGSYSLQFQNIFEENGPDVLPPDANGIADAAFRVDPVPEPATFALLGLGLAAAGLVIRRKR